MKKRLSIRELFNSSWKGFIENFMEWLLLFGAQIVVLVGFLLCCAIILAVVHYAFIDLCLFNCFFSGYSRFFTVSIVSIGSIFSMFFFIAFPIMYSQNALDVVFGRKMSGFDINNRFFSYAVAMFVYWMAVMIASCFFLLPGLFLAQRWRFVGLFILDHGGNIRQAFRSSWQMTHGYIWFLVGISMLQWLLFAFTSPTILFGIVAAALNGLIDANMYKQLHMEYDKDLSVCSCEA
ncbi:MAG: hypothetical protein JO129_01485 [Candidatus Dependentiae bacterium]|nr:hypothetical protein [Candidatus Dependentiae bacterium]